MKVNIPIETHEQYMKFWNGTFNMNDTEIRYLCTLVRAKGEFLSTENRKKARVELGISARVLNSYIAKLKKKRAIRVNSNGDYELNGLLVRRETVEVSFLRRP